MKLGMSVPLSSHTEMSRSTEKEDEVLSTEALQKHLAELYTLTGTVDDIGTVYRNLRPLWANASLSNLVGPCVNVLSKIPCCRPAVMNFIGMLIHEATHLDFSKKENPHVATDTAKIERAVRKLTNEIRRLLITTRSKGLAFDVIVWACNLFVEICKYNYERPIAKSAGITPIALLTLFDSCPAVSSAIKLADKAITLLLTTAPDECLSILIDASRHGFCFAWIWLHIAVSFPGTIIAHLLKAGLQEFKQYLIAAQNSQAPAELHESYKQKLLSVSDMFAFLATQNNAELRDAIREMICNDRDLLSATTTAEQLQNLSLPFLIRMVTNSPDVLRFLVHNALDLVTTDLVISAAIYISQLNKKCLLPTLPNSEYTYITFMRQMIFYLDSDALAHIVELALPVAFDDTIFKKFPGFKQSFRTSVKDGAIQLLSEIIGMVVSTVHNHTGLNIGENALLKQLASRVEILTKSIHTAMCGGEKSKLFIPYIHAFCIASGPVRTSEIVARFIIEAKDENGLIALIALLTSLISFAPNAPEEAVVNFFTNRTLLMLERKHARTAVQNGVFDVDLLNAEWCIDDYFDIKWLHNLRTLNEWEKMSNDAHATKHIRFEMSKHYGKLVIEVLKWTQNSVLYLKEKETIESDGMVRPLRSDVVQAAILFCLSIGPPSVLEPKYPYQISAHFASLLIMLLEYIGQEDPTALSIFTSTCTCVTQFLTSQVGYVREQFIMHLLDEALAKASTLFGCSSLNPWDTELQFSFGFQWTNCSVTEDNGMEQSLIDSARKLPLHPQKAVHLAHSGIIGSGAKRIANEEAKKGNTLRHLVFFECLQRLCSTVGPDGNLIPNQQVYKQLAMRSTDRICKEGLASSFVWEEWEQAREVIPRYIAVAKRLTETVVIWDAMFALAEIYPCLWYCCPLLKAYLATVMIQFENNSDQKSIPRKQLTDMLDKWFLLVKKGQMLPLQMVPYFELIIRVNYHEGFLILLDIWRYFQSVLEAEVSAANMINAAFERSLSSNIDRIEGDPTNFRESCRFVIQRNIAKLGFFFPLIFADEL